MRESLRVDRLDHEILRSGEVKMSSTEGFLEISQDVMDSLICKDPIEDFYDVEEEPFARGKYAVVKRCRDRTTGQQYAAKFLRKRRRSADLRSEILHEVAVFRVCSGSSNIVRLHRVFESNHEMVLLLELAAGGELQMLLDRDEVPDERQVKRLMRQILDGLVFLHSINIVHLDIKPQNLVLTEELPRGEVKLCDLGLSQFINHGADVKVIQGTPDYVAPEVISYEPVSLSADMWSAGVLLYVLLTGFSPFGGENKQETLCNVSNCKLDFPEDLFEDVSEQAIDLMQKLMVKDPSKRLTAEECLKHPWFTRRDPSGQLTTPVLTRKESIRKVPATTVARRDSLNRGTTELQKNHATPPPAVQQPPENLNNNDVPLRGMSSDRRSDFKRRMARLSRSYEGSEINNNNNEVTAVEIDLVETEPPAAVRTIAKATASKTVPVNVRRSEEKVATPVARRRQQSNVNEVTVTDGDKDCLHKFRLCYIKGDSEDESPEPSKTSRPIHGSANSIGTESGYSDNSGSDSMSEMSIDSSSDRSSIISLDDSLMEYNYVKVNGRPYPSTTSSSSTAPFNHWRNGRNASKSSRTWQFSNAFERFEDKPGRFFPEASMLKIVRKPVAPCAFMSAVNKPLIARSVDNLAPVRRVEWKVERNGNVVIREANMGKYPLVKEMKCESVKSRIRKFQAEGAKF